MAKKIIDTDKDILSVEAAALLIGLHPNTIYKAANNPKFPASRTSPRGKILINREKLIEYFSNNQKNQYCIGYMQGKGSA